MRIYFYRSIERIVLLGSLQYKKASSWYNRRWLRIGSTGENDGAWKLVLRYNPYSLMNGDFYSGFYTKIFIKILGKNLQYYEKGVYFMCKILFIKNKNKNDRI